MTSMVERVAKAIYERWRQIEGAETTWEMANDLSLKDGYPNAKRMVHLAREESRAAIAAMRQITPEMKLAMSKALMDAETLNHWPAVWNAAIDAALNEEGKG